MRSRQMVLFCIVVSLVLLAEWVHGVERGLTIKTEGGKELPLYKGSYALVIGNGNYTNGWAPLEGALQDVKEVGDALAGSGFAVTLKTDLTKKDFEREFQGFMSTYGDESANRILFYYAGHGFTQKMATGEELGFLVMVDAPTPEGDKVGFRLSSVDMQALVTEAKMVKSLHVLFMFDSCFSGSILNLREHAVPQRITDLINQPVRQFITAGRANEPVPDRSVFKQAFLDMLAGKAQEPIPDGFLTGEELGLYLQATVPQYNKAQHPQYGKIRDIALDKGDFVFFLPQQAVTQPEKREQVEGKGPDDKGHLEIRANLSGARVWVDGKEEGNAPVFIPDVTAGKHRLRIVKENCQNWESDVDVERSRKRVVVATLKPMESRIGRLFVQTDPKDARVVVLNINSEFRQGMELQAGKYELEASAEGFETHKEWIELSEGEDREMEVRLVKASAQELRMDAGPFRQNPHQTSVNPGPVRDESARPQDNQTNSVHPETGQQQSPPGEAMQSFSKDGSSVPADAGAGPGQDRPVAAKIAPEGRDDQVQADTGHESINASTIPQPHREALQESPKISSEPPIREQSKTEELSSSLKQGETAPDSGNIPEKTTPEPIRDGQEKSARSANIQVMAVHPEQVTQETPLKTKENVQSNETIEDQSSRERAPVQIKQSPPEGIVEAPAADKPKKASKRQTIEARNKKYPASQKKNDSEVAERPKEKQKVRESDQGKQTEKKPEAWSIRK